MENKHTPGPWTYGLKPLADNPLDPDTTYSTKSNYWFLKGGEGYYKNGFETTLYCFEPDVRLMHAAPDMLEALKETVSYLKSGDLLEGERYLLYKVEAAIKKAQPHE